MIGNCCQGSGPIFSRLIPFVLLSGLTKIVRFKTNKKTWCVCVCLVVVVVSLGIWKKNRRLNLHSLLNKVKWLVKWYTWSKGLVFITEMWISLIITYDSVWLMVYSQIVVLRPGEILNILHVLRLSFYYGIFSSKVTEYLLV